ncbi:hypothetical protein K469DRAFT_257811 [Zopfia rhizophila CBS 207.26]|uniref:Uncharacterized protein n=1 Tax=Zopfia rhizophila CBS 207.26 TaxID=1314779 RepID=A0A6A6DSJ2_9PEZI|nr:hypothetical protein K469DRAFT_257811 [Zopfia rhizophila CBS 207.26]
MIKHMETRRSGTIPRHGQGEGRTFFTSFYHITATHVLQDLVFWLFYGLDLHLHSSGFLQRPQYNIWIIKSINILMLQMVALTIRHHLQSSTFLLKSTDLRSPARTIFSLPLISSSLITLYKKQKQNAFSAAALVPGHGSDGPSLALSISLELAMQPHSPLWRKATVECLSLHSQPLVVGSPSFEISGAPFVATTNTTFLLNLRVRQCPLTIKFELLFLDYGATFFDILEQGDEYMDCRSSHNRDAYYVNGHVDRHISARNG